MEPHEIKPDTKLCTIIGMSAQVGIARKYFVKVFKHYNLNIAPIALNIKDEHLTITLEGLANSKIKYTYIEPEYQRQALDFCNNLNESAKELDYIDIIEINDGITTGINLEYEAKKLFTLDYQIDNNTMLMSKVLLIVKRWYKIDFISDDIPILMNK
jgi:shikimate 5-dehydrogenase